MFADPYQILKELVFKIFTVVLISRNDDMIVNVNKSSASLFIDVTIGCEQ